MRKQLRVWTAYVTILLALSGCRTQLAPRVVRLELNSGPTPWRFSVNGSSGFKRSCSDFALIQQLNDLHLSQGDVILLGVPRARKAAFNKGPLDWVSSACRSNRVAVYLLVEPVPGVDMFSVRVYHWMAPYDNPFDLAEARFFCEGRPLGRDTAGFDAMLHQIAHNRPKQAFILGSRFDAGQGFPPDPAPYERQRERLAEVLRAAGTDLISLAPMP